MTLENSIETFDLVDEMNWEDSDKVEKISLEEAGLEEELLTSEIEAKSGTIFHQGLLTYLDWFYDGEQSEFDM
jgi:hypothetical protein